MGYYYDTFSRGEKVIFEIKSSLLFRSKFLSVRNKRHICTPPEIHPAHSYILLASITPRFVLSELSVKLIGNLLCSDLTLYFA